MESRLVPLFLLNPLVTYLKRGGCRSLYLGQSQGRVYHQKNAEQFQVKILKKKLEKTNLNLCQNFSLISLNLKSSTTTSEVNEQLNPTATAERKKGGKTVEVEKIMLMSETGKITVETLTDAEKMAKKKGFRLAEVKELESKFHTDKKVYKFETLEEHFKEEWGKSDVVSSNTIYGKEKESRRKKEEKTILLKSKITIHDIEAKVKQMNRLVEKGYPIRVFISGEGGNSDLVFKTIQAQLTSSGKITQRKLIGNEIKFQIQPIKSEEALDVAGKQINHSSKP